LMILSFSL